MQNSLKAYIDFEFNNTSEEHVNLVCCSLKVEDGPVEQYWLHEDVNSQAKLFSRLVLLNDEEFTFVAYGVTAEARSFLAMHLNPNVFNWIDLYVEYKLLLNNNLKYTTGRHLVKGKPTHISGSKKIVEMIYESAFKYDGWLPPKLQDYADMLNIDPRFDSISDLNFGEPDKSLAACALRMCNVELDTDHKNEMRDAIISGNIIGNEKHIQEYCDSDVEILPAILDELYKANCATYGKEFVDSSMLSRGLFSATLAQITNTGIPIDVEWLNHISDNGDKIVMSGKREICEKYRKPFFILEPKIGKKGKPLKNPRVGQMQTSVRDEYGKEIGLDLPYSSKTGKPSWSDEHTKKLTHVPFVKDYRDLQKDSRAFGYVQKVKEKGKRSIFEAIGTDGKLRTFFNPFGSQTGRNQPPASIFPFAMSKWIRSIIKPPEGYTLVSLDYKSQEFAIAAYLSNDENMIADYKSGDVYSGFLDKAGIDKKYRNPIGKPVVLGKQFGMEIEGLAQALSPLFNKDSDFDWDGADAREKSLNLAKYLDQKHREAYCTYYRWKGDCVNTYYTGVPFILKDWAMGCDNPNERSASNLNMQGTGAVMMREVCNKTFQYGLISPLHDGFYYCIKNDVLEETVKKIKAVMMQVSIEVIGGEIFVDDERYEGRYIADKEKYEKIVNLTGNTAG